MTHLFKRPLHRLVRKQSDGSHQIPDENEVALCFEVEGKDVVEVATLNTQLLLGRPLKKTNLRQHDNKGKFL